MGLELVQRKSKGAGAADEPFVIAGERYGLTLPSKKLHRGQMKRVQGSYRLREGFQRSREYGRSQFYESQATQKGANFVCVRSRQFPCVDPGPNLIFDEPAGNQRLLPQAVGRRTVLRQEVSERDRSIEINQRSLRSCSSSFFSLRKDVTGLRGGGVNAARAGGVIQPLRTASDSKASANTGLLVAWGGTISATTRSRSVTSTVSPPSARRTYSLSLFFRTFRPTAFISANVASGSYQCQETVVEQLVTCDNRRVRRQA